MLVRTADLAEAEGREFRRMTVRVALACGVAVAATAAVVGGLALLLGSLYMVCASAFGAAGAAGVVGAVSLGVGGGLAWLARRMVR